MAFLLIPPIDLCTGMSILFLYHKLGITKRSDSKQSIKQNGNSNFDSLINESESQMRETLYDIKMKGNRAAQPHPSDSILVSNPETNLEFE